MGIQRSIGLLHPDMQPGVNLYIELARKELGLELMVLETLRTLDVQYAYYARGRTDPDFVRALFKRSSLWALTDAECKTINTKTLYSKHIDGLAIDVFPVKNGKVWWDCPKETLEKLFAIAEERCGLDACASGKFEAWQWDWPHHEFRSRI